MCSGSITSKRTHLKNQGGTNRCDECGRILKWFEDGPICGICVENVRIVSSPAMLTPRQADRFNDMLRNV